MTAVTEEGGAAQGSRRGSPGRVLGRVLGGPRRALSRMPLRIKLVAMLVALVALALAATSVAATTSLRGYLVQRVDGQLLDAALKISHNIPIGYVGREGPGRLPSVYYVEVIRADGSSLGGLSAPLHGGEVPPALPPSLSVLLARASHPFTVGSVGDQGPRWRVLVEPLVSGGALVTAVSLGDIRDTVGRLFTIDLVVSLVVLVLLAALGYYAVRRSLRPLVEVESTAEAIAGGALHRRVPEGDPRTEVGRLGGALNAMLAQIESAFHQREASEAAARTSEARMRRFVTDASHELRTPLTSIRGYAELHRQGAAPTPEDVTRVLHRIEAEATRMGLLVDDLLLLARLDQQRPLERRPVDLLVIAADAASDARAVAPLRAIGLAVIGDGVVPVVLGDEARLRQVVGNLVSNALTHTPASASVTIRVGTAAPSAEGRPWALIEVSDTGPGLSDEDAARVFERFFRADPSRTRSLGGTGLGLSIVAGLTAAHGGQVELETHPGIGATFRVLLPLAEEGPEPD